MKKKVMILVSIIALVFMLGMTTVFATSYSSTMNFKGGLTGTARQYNTYNADTMKIDCWSTSYEVPSGYERTDTGAVTYDVKLMWYNDLMSPGAYISEGYVTGFPMSNYTYSGTWYNVGKNSFLLQWDWFYFYFKAGSQNHTQKITDHTVKDYVRIYGACRMYNE